MIDKHRSLVYNNKAFWQRSFAICRRIEVVITGLTRNQFAGNRTWVRISPSAPRKKHLLRQVLFSMISVPYGTDDISTIWYPLSADDICLRHMNGTDIISCLLRKYIIRRKPYIILRQQYIMMHKAYIKRPFFIGFSSIAPELSALWLSITLTDWAKRSRWQSLRCAAGGGRSKQGLAQWSIFRERERARKIGYHKRKRDC